MHMGFRRYNVRPIYSQNTNKGSNNVHKFERFIQLGRSYVATVYGPIAFGKTPVMFYKETENKNGKQKERGQMAYANSSQQNLFLCPQAHLWMQMSNVLLLNESS